MPYRSIDAARLNVSAASATPLPFPFPYLNHHPSTYSPHIHLRRPLLFFTQTQSTLKARRGCSTTAPPSSSHRPCQRDGIRPASLWRGRSACGRSHAGGVQGGFAEWFLHAGFAHLPAGSPVMFRLEEVHPNSRTPPIGLTVTFTNRFDAYYLLGKVF